MDKKHARHSDIRMKLRIALQLFLDILPVILLLVGLSPFFGGIPRGTPGEILEKVFGFPLALFAVGTIPAFILAFWLGRDLPEFDVWPAWGVISRLLRGLSTIPLILAVMLDVCLIATALDIMWYMNLI